MSNTESTAQTNHPSTSAETNPTPIINIQDYQPSMASTLACPKKEDAIIIEAHDNLTLLDYAAAVTKLTTKDAIKFISKISRGRIKIFLPTAKEAETFIEKNPSLEIKNITLKTRLFINPNKRLFISGACPTIPNDYIQKCLESIGIACIGTPQHMKAFNYEEFAHILLEKRFCFYKPSDVSIPSKIIITYEDIEHLVYLEEENNNCRICKKSGHSANRCPNATQHPSVNLRIENIRQNRNEIHRRNSKREISCP